MLRDILRRGFIIIVTAPGMCMVNVNAVAWHVGSFAAVYALFLPGPRGSDGLMGQAGVDKQTQTFGMGVVCLNIWHHVGI